VQQEGIWGRIVRSGWDVGALDCKEDVEFHFPFLLYPSVANLKIYNVTRSSTTYRSREDLV
jgi:hypothetical protein